MVAVRGRRGRGREDLLDDHGPRPLDRREPLDREQPAEDRRPSGVREAGARAEAEAKVTRGVVGAAEDLERGRVVLEDSVALGDDGAAGDLGTDEELAVEAPQAGGEAEVGLGAHGMAREGLIVSAIDDAERRRVREPAQVPGGRYVGPDPDLTVAEVVLLAPGRSPHPAAEGERERVAVATEQPEVGGHAEVADAPLTSVDDLLTVHDVPGDVAGLADRDRQATPMRRRSKRTSEPPTWRMTCSVTRCSFHEPSGLSRVYGWYAQSAIDPERGPHLAPEVEGVVGVPFAPGLRRLEPVEREPRRRRLRLRPGRPGGDRHAGERGEGDGGDDPACAGARRTSFHGSLPEQGSARRSITGRPPR